jgi:hypothetical protein
MVGLYLAWSIEYLFARDDKQPGGNTDKGKDKYNCP